MYPVYTRSLFPIQEGKRAAVKMLGAGKLYSQANARLQAESASGPTSLPCSSRVAGFSTTTVWVGGLGGAFAGAEPCRFKEWLVGSVGVTWLQTAHFTDWAPYAYCAGQVSHSVQKPSGLHNSQDLPCLCMTELDSPQQSSSPRIIAADQQNPVTSSLVLGLNTRGLAL